MTEIESLSLWDAPADEVVVAKQKMTAGLAMAAVQPLWPYLSAATTRGEFEHRMGLVEDGIASRVAAVIPEGSEGYDGLAKAHLSALWDGFDADRIANRLRTASLGHVLAGDGQTAEVMAFPQCDICKTNEAAYDGKTKMGPWAYMCQKHFDQVGVGLGLGQGQKLVLAPSSKQSAAVVHKAVSASTIGKDLYCGADSGPDSWEWDEVTCPNCLAKKGKTSAATSDLHPGDHILYKGEECEVDEVISDAAPPNVVVRFLNSNDTALVWAVDCQKITGYFADGSPHTPMASRTSTRKRAWTADGSDITPGASKMMSLQNQAYDALGVNGFAGPDDPKRRQVIDWIKDHLGDVKAYTQADIDCAEDYNAHASVQAVMEAQGTWTASLHTGHTYSDEDKRKIMGPKGTEITAEQAKEILTKAVNGGYNARVYGLAHNQIVTLSTPDALSKFAGSLELIWQSKAGVDDLVSKATLHTAYEQEEHTLVGQPIMVDVSTCRTCGGKILGIKGKWAHDPRAAAPNHPDGSVAGDAHAAVPHEASLHTAPGGGPHAPYNVEERGDKWVVVNDLGEVKGTHDSKEQAREQQKALYSQVPGAREQAERKSGSTATFPAWRTEQPDAHFEGVNERNGKTGSAGITNQTGRHSHPDTGGVVTAIGGSIQSSRKQAAFGAGTFEIRNGLQGFLESEFGAMTFPDKARMVLTIDDREYNVSLVLETATGDDGGPVHGDVSGYYAVWFKRNGQMVDLGGNQYISPGKPNGPQQAYAARNTAELVYNNAKWLIPEGTESYQHTFHVTVALSRDPYVIGSLSAVQALLATYVEDDKGEADLQRRHREYWNAHPEEYERHLRQNASRTAATEDWDEVQQAVNSAYGGDRGQAARDAGWYLTMRMRNDYGPDHGGDVGSSDISAALYDLYKEWSAGSKSESFPEFVVKETEYYSPGGVIGSRKTADSTGYLGKKPDTGDHVKAEPGVKDRMCGAVARGAIGDCVRPKGHPMEGPQGFHQGAHGYAWTDEFTSKSAGVLDRSAIFTILLNVMPSFGQMKMTDGSEVVSRCLTDWEQSGATDMYAFVKDWAAKEEATHGPRNANRRQAGRGLICAECGHVDDAHHGKWCDACASTRSASDPAHAFVPQQGKQAVNEGAQGTERYQHVDVVQRPSWITEWADEEMKATKEMTEEGMNAYVKPNPFPNLTTLQQVRSAALKMAAGTPWYPEIDEVTGETGPWVCSTCGTENKAGTSVCKECGMAPGVDAFASRRTAGDQAYTTKPAQVPGQDEAPHMVTIDQQIIPPSIDMAQPPGDVSDQMGSGGGFDMGYGPDTSTTMDPMSPTPDQMVAAKAARVAERIRLDNPSMGLAEAKRLALMTIAKHPEMVKASR